MIPVDEARAAVLGRVRPVGTERVPLEQAPSRVLRAPAHADRDFPPFDRAAMDGFACRAADAVVAGAMLRIIGEVRAGQIFSGEMSALCAVRIMTGAPVPHGADAVIQVEKTQETDGHVTIDAVLAPGQNIVPRGTEARAGALVLPSGTRLDAAAIAILASVGIAEPLVSRRPRVAVIVTGDEVVEPNRIPEPAQIRNANGPALAAAIRDAGGEPAGLALVPDDLEATRRAIAEAFENAADAVVLSGGVSAGSFDFVEEALRDLGVALHVTAVRVKPGAPFVFGTRGAVPVFGLPGNPVSAQVTFDLFVRPALLAMQAATAITRRTLIAALAEPLRNRSGRRNYLPVRIRTVEGGLIAVPVRTQGSGDVAAHAAANALAILEPDRTEALAGERVEIHPLTSFLEV